MATSKNLLSPDSGLIDRSFSKEGAQRPEHSPNSSPLVHHLLFATVQGEVDWLCAGALTSRVLKKTTDDSTAQRLARRLHSVLQHIFTYLKNSLNSLY
jgi:hypothetical protein